MINLLDYRIVLDQTHLILDICQPEVGYLIVRIFWNTNFLQSKFDSSIHVYLKAFKIDCVQKVLTQTKFEDVSFDFLLEYSSNLFGLAIEHHIQVIPINWEMAWNCSMLRVVVCVLHDAIHLPHGARLVKEFTLREVHEFMSKGILELN